MNPQAELTEFLSQLQSSDKGLTTAAARARLAASGPNELAAERQPGAVGELLRPFANPLIAILLLAGIVVAWRGDLLNASIIIALVGLPLAFRVYQSRGAQQTIVQLRAKVAPITSTLRDGKWVKLPTRELVRGDVIRLVAGDAIPADARLLNARDLRVMQEALTGDAISAPRQPHDGATTLDTLLAPNLLFFGTTVASGSGTAVVYATGVGTLYSELRKRLSATRPEPDIERGQRQLSLLLTRTGLGIVLLVLLVGAALQREPLGWLLFALALAVGLTPELLQSFTTMALARSAEELAEQKLIVKQLPAIQILGSMDVLCCDTSGLLTNGALELYQQMDYAGGPSRRVGLLAYLNAQHERGVAQPANRAIREKWRKSGPPNMSPLNLDYPDAASYQKVGEIPFDAVRQRQTVVVQYSAERMLVTLGIPESILPICAQYERTGYPIELEEVARGHADKTHHTFSTMGYRVLAVAHRSLPAQAVYTHRDECGLTLAGFITFFDPPLPGAAEALRALGETGVALKLLTEDNAPLIRHVCSQVGLDDSRMVTGDEVARLSDSALAQVVEQTTIFTRVSPTQKSRLIRALQSRSHVVGYYGAGSDDAGPLRAADISIAPATAVSAAKDAADIILMERNLTTLRAGIAEGRRVSGNVLNYWLISTGSHLGNLLSAAGALLFVPFLPMLPAQLLVSNFLTGLAQNSLLDDSADTAFARRPRRWDARLARVYVLLIGPLSALFDLLTFGVLLYLLRAAEPEFQTAWFIEALLTQTLVLFVLRTAGNPLRSLPGFGLIATAIVVLAVGVALPYSPVAHYLGFVPLPPIYFVGLLAASLAYLLCVAALKHWLMQRLSLKQS